jgi:hypothetical protein
VTKYLSPFLLAGFSQHSGLDLQAMAMAPGEPLLMSREPHGEFVPEQRTPPQVESELAEPDRILGPGVQNN